MRYLGTIIAESPNCFYRNDRTHPLTGKFRGTIYGAKRKHFESSRSAALVLRDLAVSIITDGVVVIESHLVRMKIPVY